MWVDIELITDDPDLSIVRFLLHSQHSYEDITTKQSK
jgi:hypothetical protein